MLGKGMCSVVLRFGLLVSLCQPTADFPNVSQLFLFAFGFVLFCLLSLAGEDD